MTIADGAILNVEQFALVSGRGYEKVGGVILGPNQIIVAGEAFAASLRHVGYRYGANTTLSFSFDNAVGHGYTDEDTGNIGAGTFLTYGCANSSEQAKFGPTSLLIPTYGYTLIPGTWKAAAYADFTIEFWAFSENAPWFSTFVMFDGGGSKLGMEGGLVYTNWQANGNKYGTTSIPSNTWVHIAMSRKGNVVRVFLNGTAEITYVQPAEITLYCFGVNQPNSRKYLDSFAFAKDYCHYPSDFQTPVRPFFFAGSGVGVQFSEVQSIVAAGEATGTFMTPAEYDPHWRNTTLLLRGNGENFSTNVVEAKGFYLGNSGTTKVEIRTDTTKYVGSSMYFSGTSLLTVESGPFTDFRYGDFTIEMWIRPTQGGLEQWLISRWGQGWRQRAWWMKLDASNQPYFEFWDKASDSVTRVTAPPVQVDQWSFVAFARRGNIYTIWTNGQQGTSIDTVKVPWWVSDRDYSDWHRYDCETVIGCGDSLNQGSNYFKGYMEDLRITNGISRYSVAGNIEPPIKPFVAQGASSDGDPYWGDVKRLIHFNERAGTTYNIRDAKGYPVVLGGASRTELGGPIGNFLSSYPQKPSFTLQEINDFDLSSGDFTIEFWAYGFDQGDANVLSCHNGQSGAAARGYLLSNRGKYFYEEDGTGYFSWQQWNSTGQYDIAVTPYNVLSMNRWSHVAVQRRGDVLTIFVDGKGYPTTVTRRPAPSGVGLTVGGGSANPLFLSSFRFTRLARYSGDFLPQTGRLPEFLATESSAVISETISFVPGSPRAGATIEGPTFGYAYKFEIPKVVMPVISEAHSLSVFATPTGGEGAGENLEFAEGFVLSQSMVAGMEGVTVDDSVSAQFVAGVAEDLILRSPIPSVSLANVSVRSAVALTSEFTRNATYLDTEDERYAVASRVRVALSTPIADQIQVSTGVVLTKCAEVLSTINMSEAQVLQFLFLSTISEVAVVRDSLPSGIAGATATDELTLSTTADLLRTVPVAVVSSMGLHGELLSGLNVQLTIPEAMSLADDISPAQLLNILASEAVEFSAFMASPSFTTWVMNTRTNAVSEYADYQFNSFTQIGERVLGAGDAGLFWLDGEDDNGTPIEAVIQPGVVQPHGNLLANVHYAYLGMRGDSDFVFTVVDEAGKSFDYRLDANSMKTGRVPFGRGLKTRYFTFRVRSLGGDFDLDNIEFVTRETARKIQR